MERKFYIKGTEYTFEERKMNGVEVIAAYYTQNGESFGQWTTEAQGLPESEDEATEYIEKLDWDLDTSELE